MNKQTILVDELIKQSDVIAVISSPIDNIEELLEVDFVMKEGKVFKNK